MTAAKGRRKMVRRDTDPVNELDVHAGKFGFVLKGIAAKRFSLPIILLIIVVVMAFMALWTLKTWPQLLHLSQVAADKGVTIEQKVDEVKKTEAKHHRELRSEMQKLEDGMEAQAEVLSDLKDELHADSAQKQAVQVAQEGR